MLTLARSVKHAVETTLDKISRFCGQCLPETTPAQTFILSEPGSHVYCGYYDISPFNADNSRLLALRVKGGNVSPHESGIKAEIGYFNLPHTKFIKVAESAAWNWQQGCRLQWLPNASNTVIYNDFQNGHFVSVVRRIDENGPLRTYSHPVYTVHTDGMNALSLDFTRLHRHRRGYGYHNLDSSQEKAPADDGLWCMDMNDGTLKLLVSLAELASFQTQDGMAGAYHYINHLQWTPDGKTIVFFHLWHRDGKKKNSRFVILKQDGTLSILDQTIRPSHTGWANDGSLLLTGLKQGSKNIYHLHNKIEKSEELPITIDGHPSFINNNTFLSDTYPDKTGHQKLYISDLQGNRKMFASFYMPSDYTGEMRCDLHPRLSPDKTLCAVDIVKDSKRAIAIIPVKP